MNVRNNTEEWRPVVGYEGLYEVSSHGRVRSLVNAKPRILKRIRNDHGYLNVGLYRDKKQQRIGVHRLVATAFIPNPDGLPFVRHRNDVPHENNVSNLTWGTAGDNGVDASLNGARPRKTHCNHNHALTDDNIYIDRGARVCATCSRARSRANYARQKKG